MNKQMEKLVNLTQTDINNGALNRLLINVGIPDVQEYIKTFHQETEELIIEELEHPKRNKTDNDEQIVPPTDVQSWVTSLRLRLDDPNQPPLSEKQQQQLPQDVQSLISGLRPVINNTDQIHSTEQSSKKPAQQLTADVQSWITGLRPRFDDPVQPSPSEPQQPPLPTDLTSWVHGIAPTNLSSSNDITITTLEPAATPTSDAALTGNLGTWLTDWTKNLTEQPPPASLDHWLQGLVSQNMHEPIGKTTSPKGRLNTYLNAAQEVLSQHGYNVSNEITPTTNIEQTKGGMFGNVKQMYFLWKTLDKNNDRKITVEDVQIMLQEMGLGFLSKYVATTLFDMVDSNHDGCLSFRDFVALMSIIKQLISAIGSAKTNV